MLWKNCIRFKYSILVYNQICFFINILVPLSPPVLPAWPLLAWPVTIYWGVIKTKRPLMMVDPRPIINSTPPSLSKVWLDRSESTRLDFFDIGSIFNRYQYWKEMLFYRHEFITKRLWYKLLLVIDNWKVISLCLAF